MRTYMRYLLLTGKRLLRQLPYFLAGLAVMVLLVGMAAFSASKVLYGETSLKKIEVGVVLPEDDALSEKITKMIASLDSVESLCDFSYLEHDEAFQKMKSGELQAVFEVPSGMARGILDGTNQPATIWFPDESGLEGAVFRELAESGSSMLGTSQAAIYAANECLNIQGVPEQISVSEQDLNRIFLKYAMNREALFRKKTVSAAGNVSTAVFSDDSYRNPGSAVSGSPDGGAGTGASAHRDPAVVSAFLQMLVHDASSDGSHGGRLWLGGAEGICAGGAGRTGGVGADLRGSFGVDSAVL